MASLDKLKKRCVFVEEVDGRLFWRKSSIEKKDLKQIAERMVAKLTKKKESASAFELGILVRKRGSVSSE